MSDEYELDQKPTTLANWIVGLSLCMLTTAWFAEQPPPWGVMLAYVGLFGLVTAVALDSSHKGRLLLLEQERKQALMQGESALLKFAGAVVDGS